MTYFDFIVFILSIALVVQQTVAVISLDQVGQCKSILYQKRIENINLKNIHGELTNVYVASDYQPSVVCYKQTFTPNEGNNQTFSLVSSSLVLQTSGEKKKVTSISQVLPNSDGSFTITENTSYDGKQTELNHALYILFNGASGGHIFYICNPSGTSINDLRFLALPTKGIAYGAYGISEMLQIDNNLGFSGKLRKLQRC